jgi:hypothetical protein
MAGAAVEALLVVSPIRPLPLLKIHPPSLLVCCFFVFAKMGGNQCSIQKAGGKPIFV